MSEGLDASARETANPIGRLLWRAASSVHLSGLYFGRIRRSWLRFEHVDMPLPNLGESLEGRRLVHLSDVHCCPIVLDSYLNQCIDHVNSLDGDFVVITGDIITGGTRYADKAARLLGRLRAKMGVIASLGNHDYGIVDPSGRGHMRQLADYLHRKLALAGLTVLRNEHAIFHHAGAALQFVGADDIWSPHYNPWAAFGGTVDGLPTICLSHNPDSVFDMIEQGAHWVLTGHTHGNAAGETPMVDHVAPQRHKQFVGGYYRVGDGHLYVNRGLAYARRKGGNPRPEVTVFTLRQASTNRRPQVPARQAIEA